MCRAGGRRCPSSQAGEHRELVNAKRRWVYAEQKYMEADRLHSELMVSAKSAAYKQSKQGKYFDAVIAHYKSITKNGAEVARLTFREENQ